MICTRDMSDVEYPKPCPDCAHPGIAHPFNGNALEACVICEMVAIRDSLQVFADETANQMRALAERARRLIEDYEEGAPRG